MRRKTIFLVLAVIACLVFAANIARQFAPTPITQPLITTAQTQSASTPGELVGVSSCSASPCHGGSVIGAPLSEAATWQGLDPHARAYRTLLSKAAQDIAERLWSDNTQAHEAALCLKCHVHPQYDKARPNFRKQDGVGCESCHGGASGWLTPHYRPGWRPSLGMLDTKSLPGRASICTTCHVGTPDANVDHDLIAAGHPPLRFEFATYFANLPAHWDVAKDRKAHTSEAGVDFDFQAWVIGQRISSAAAAELLAYRADPANGQAWPEFAELDCFACHHDLRDKSWRKASFKNTGRRPGGLALNDWYGAMAFITNPHIERGQIPEQAKPLDLFKDRAASAQKMKAYASDQREIAKNGRAGPDQIAHLKQAAEIIDKADARVSSDFSAQLYLALLAGRGHFNNDKLIERMRRHATFPLGFNSPHEARPD